MDSRRMEWSTTPPSVEDVKTHGDQWWFRRNADSRAEVHDVQIHDGRVHFDESISDEEVSRFRGEWCPCPTPDELRATLSALSAPASPPGGAVGETDITDSGPGIDYRTTIERDANGLVALTFRIGFRREWVELSPTEWSRAVTLLSAPLPDDVRRDVDLIRGAVDRCVDARRSDRHRALDRIAARLNGGTNG